MPSRALVSNLVGFLSLILLTLAPAHARGTVTNVAYWRFGEGDSGSAEAITATSTANVLGGDMNLVGGPIYTTNISATAVARCASRLGLHFVSGIYGTNVLFSALTNNFGIELWAKPDITNATQILIYNGRVFTNGWGILIYTNGQYRGLVGLNMLLGSPAPVVQGVWVHLALVRDNGVATFYINGVSNAATTVDPGTPTGRFAVAINPQDFFNNPASGSMDELRLFTFAPGTFSTNDLLINSQPPIASTAAATDLMPTSATLNGSVKAGSFATATWFEWGGTTNYGNCTTTNTLAPSNTALAVSNTLAGLSVGFTYCFRSASGNLLGVSYGTNVTFATPAFTNATATAFPLGNPPGVYNSSVAWADYDNDGRLDFLVTGMDGSTGVAQLWYNTGDGFTNVPIDGLPGVSQGSVAWADYDNDGRLDFLLTGTDGSAGVAQLWHNTGNGFTNVSIAGLLGVYQSSASWADYDNDGRLDFLLTGTDGTNGVAQLWRNTGNGFTNETSTVAPGLQGVFQAAVAWGDYDNDGRLDFLLTGDTGTGPISQLWRNTDGGFTNVTATAFPPGSLSDISGSSVAWGDYDSDGYIDFLFVGRIASGAIVRQLWRNTGNGFTLKPVSGLAAVSASSMAWGDYDNDGRLDLLWTGGHRISQLWRSTGDQLTNAPMALLPAISSGSVAWGDYNSDGRLDFLLTGATNINSPGTGIFQLWCNVITATNTPPGAPTDLKLTASSNSVMLSWNSAIDEKTPAASLTYNVRAGTTPGNFDLLAAHVDITNGFRRVPAMGNSMLRHSLPLTGVTNGQTIYWSVQAVDTSFAGGPFAAETSVVSIPQLSISPSDATNAVISWTPPTFGWRLQEGANPAVGQWSNSPSGGLNPVTVGTTNGSQFYRLANP